MPPRGSQRARTQGRGQAADVKRAEDKAEALRLRREGASFRAIAAALGCGSSHAHVLVKEALREIVGEPAEELRQLEAERLRGLIAKAYEVLAANHITVQHGKIVRDEFGEAIPDHGPILAAINTIRALSAELRKLHGLDMPTRTDVTVHQVDPADLALAEILREAQARNAVLESAIKGETLGGE